MTNKYAGNAKYVKSNLCIYWKSFIRWFQIEGVSGENHFENNKHIFIFCTFIEKVHLKKYTDILPFTDCRYRCSKRVHSVLLCYDTSYPWYHKHSSFVDISLEREHGSMTCNIFSEQKDKLFNYKFFIFCTLLHQGATRLCSIITNENRLETKEIIT